MGRAGDEGEERGPADDQQHTVRTNLEGEAVHGVQRLLLRSEGWRRGGRCAPRDVESGHRAVSGEVSPPRRKNRAGLTTTVSARSKDSLPQTSLILPAKAPASAPRRPCSSTAVPPIPQPSVHSAARWQP